jgi:hypothetical protein
MICPDLTEVFEKYSEWDYVVRNKYIRYVANLLKQNDHITCRGIQYHYAEDLKVDLEADCYQNEREAFQQI